MPLWLTIVATLAGSPAAEPGIADARVYDIVIAGGTVVDPEAMSRSVRHIGIDDGRIVALSEQPLAGRRVLDASGSIVSPGFIDLTSYGPFRYASKFKVADGVTAALTLHGGTGNFAPWAARQSRQRPMVHYGAAVSHHFMRKTIGPKNRYAAASPLQIRRMLRQARASLEAGALGISFSLEYTPGASTDEVRPLMQLAAEMNVPTFFHLRHSDPLPPGTNAEAVDEVITLARQTGARVIIHHLTSTGGTFTMNETRQQIDAARREGLEITANIYPYGYWGTYLQSARFDRGWQKRFRIGYGDLQLAGTDRRMTVRMFKRLRKSKRVAIAYAIPEEDIVTALKTPWVSIGSDSVISRSGRSHPRGAGCFARFIGKYVREEKVLSLEEAIRKVTLQPAQLLESVAPAMRTKGRLRQGMDADIVVFDLDTIRDASTVEEPRQYSEGIRFVLIGGVVVRDHDRVVHAPTGMMIRAAPKASTELSRASTR